MNIKHDFMGWKTVILSSTFHLNDKLLFLNNTLYYHHSAYTSNKEEIPETENPKLATKW